MSSREARVAAALHEQQPETAGEHARAIGDAEQPVAEHAGAHVQRVRQRRAADDAGTVRRVEHVDPETRLDRELVRRPDAVEEAEHLGVAAHHRVLAVVDDLARRLVGVGVGAPAEHRTLLEHGHAPARRRERGRRREAGEAAAHDEDVAHAGLS